jgi:hypothetical protein
MFCLFKWRKLQNLAHFGQKLRPWMDKKRLWQAKMARPRPLDSSPFATQLFDFQKQPEAYR